MSHCRLNPTRQQSQRSDSQRQVLAGWRSEVIYDGTIHQPEMDDLLLPHAGRTAKLKQVTQLRSGCFHDTSQ